MRSGRVLSSALLRFARTGCCQPVVEKVLPTCSGKGPYITPPLVRGSNDTSLNIIIVILVQTHKKEKYIYKKVKVMNYKLNNVQKYLLLPEKKTTRQKFTLFTWNNNSKYKFTL